MGQPARRVSLSLAVGSIPWECFAHGLGDLYPLGGICDHGEFASGQLVHGIKDSSSIGVSHGANYLTDTV